MTSLISLSPLQGVALSLFLLLIEQFLERTGFYWTTLYLQPMPDFELDDNKWDGMAFVIRPPHVTNPPWNCIGIVFTEPIYASKFFELLRSWNYGAQEDRDNNIQLSFVVEEDYYYVFLYPGFERRSVKTTHAKWRRSQRFAQYGKKHFGLIMSLVICKDFSTTHGFGLGQFADAQPDGDPFLLIACLKTGTSFELLSAIPPIQKWHFKYKHESELRPDEFERVYLRIPRRGESEGV